MDQHDHIAEASKMVNIHTLNNNHRGLSLGILKLFLFNHFHVVEKVLLAIHQHSILSRLTNTINGTTNPS
jgi:hypothetical protein